MRALTRALMRALMRPPTPVLTPVTMTVAALRAQLAAISPPPAPGRRALPTGIAELDALIPDRGLPLGRLTEVAGTRGSGRTTLLRALVERTALDGALVACVDARRTLAPRDWARMRDVWMVRPPEPARAAWCADVLLRSGAFALVVLDGAPPLPSAVAVRLVRLARDGGSALVIAGEGRGTLTPAALRLGVRREGQRLKVVVEKGGIRRTVEVVCAASVASRLCEDPEIPDRRGVERRSGVG